MKKPYKNIGWRGSIRTRLADELRKLAKQLLLCFVIAVVGTLILIALEFLPESAPEVDSLLATTLLGILWVGIAIVKFLVNLITYACGAGCILLILAMIGELIAALVEYIRCRHNEKRHTEDVDYYD